MLGKCLANMKYISPLIIASDIEKSRDFYVEILGQKVKDDHGPYITFEDGFAVRQKENFQRLINNKWVKPGGNSFELFFESNEIRMIQDKLEAIQIVFIHKLREQPWGQRVIRFYDPDQHIIEVGESMEFTAFRLFKKGRKINEISETTNLSTNFIQGAITKFDIKKYEGRVPACGCFCGGCPSYLRQKNPCPGADINRARCEKCRTFHLCCQEKGVTHCHQCEDFPCKKFRNWTRRWEKYGQNFIENQQILKCAGPSGFLEHFNGKVYHSD